MKKKIALLMAAVMLFGVTIGATIAYLTSTTGVVTNTFTVGNIEITLDESLVDIYGEKYLVSNAVDANNNGVIEHTEIVAKGDAYTETEADPNEIANATRVMENDYKLIPGHTYIKDPTVHVKAQSENSYIFVKVTNGISNIESGTTIAAQMVANGWKALDGVNNVFYYIGVASKGETVNENGYIVNTLNLIAPATLDLRVFDNFTVGSDKDVSGFVNSQITIKAYAVQSDNMISAADAWTKAGFGA